MSFLTKSAPLRSAVFRPVLPTASRAHKQVRFATQDYGSGAGNPAGEKPQQQGKNPSEHIEHPGPPPPKVAQGQSSSSPNNNDTSSRSSSSSSGSSSSGKESQSNKAPSKQDNKSSKGAQPKILNEKAPTKEDQSGDVQKHNQEMKDRTDKAHEQADK